MLGRNDGRDDPCAPKNEAQNAPLCAANAAQNPCSRAEQNGGIARSPVGDSGTLGDRVANLQSAADGGPGPDRRELATTPSPQSCPPSARSLGRQTGKQPTFDLASGGTQRFDGGLLRSGTRLGIRHQAATAGGGLTVTS